MDDIKKKTISLVINLSDYQMSNNPVIEINNDAGKIEIDIDKIDEIDDDKIDEIDDDKIDVDKIDFDKIEVDKIDIDKIDVDKNDDDKIFTFDGINDEPHKLHNGKPITMMETSPNEKYLITYSEEDCSVVGWNVENIDKVQLKFDQTVKIIDDDNKYELKCLCVSDDK
jgi:hypothetical protein